jgi:hypothetical protein
VRQPPQDIIGRSDQKWTKMEGWKSDGSASQLLKTRHGDTDSNETSPDKEKLPIDEAHVGETSQGGGNPSRAETGAGRPKILEAPCDGMMVGCSCRSKGEGRCRMCKPCKEAKREVERCRRTRVQESGSGGGRDEATE